MRTKNRNNLIARTCVGVASMTFAAGSVRAAVFIEAEPNNTKLTANMVVLTGAGDQITGVTTGDSTEIPGVASADYFRVTTPSMPLGIYYNRLEFPPLPASPPVPMHNPSIRGLGQTALNLGNPAGSQTGPGIPNQLLPDQQIQTGRRNIDQLVVLTNRWYTFGRPASIYYRVAGVPETTSPYVVTYDVEPVVPVQIGTFAAGEIVLSNLGTGPTPATDTEILIYDENLVALGDYLNDDVLDGFPMPPGSDPQNSRLARNFAPGTYYIAIGRGNTADHRLSPVDDGNANAGYLDFEGVVVAADHYRLTVSTLAFTITDVNGTTVFDAYTPDVDGVFWGTFTVVPEPSSLAVFAVPVVLIARRARYRRMYRGE